MIILVGRIFVWSPKKFSDCPIWPLSAIMHQRENLELLSKIVLLIFFTSKLSSSLEIVTTNKVVAKPGEDAELVCEADSIVDECSWFAPEKTPDINRKDKMLEIQLKIDFMIGGLFRCCYGRAGCTDDNPKRCRKFAQVEIVGNSCKMKLENLKPKEDGSGESKWICSLGN